MNEIKFLGLRLDIIVLIILAVATAYTWKIYEVSVKVSDSRNQDIFISIAIMLTLTLAGLILSIFGNIFTEYKFNKSGLFSISCMLLSASVALMLASDSTVDGKNRLVAVITSFSAFAIYFVYFMMENKALILLNEQQ
jgi:hypothetical protein